MSRYTVVSAPDAEEELASIWMEAENRNRISAAADAADTSLSENPFRDSIHLSEQLRRRDFPPLRFYFEVREQDRIVAISNVTRLPNS